MSLRAAGPGLLQSSQSFRGFSVSEIGDSITATNNPSLDLFNITGAPNWTSANLLAQFYNNIRKSYSIGSWVAHGAMRSGGAWFPYEWVYGYSGLRSDQILQYCLPVLLNNPYGLPDMCSVMAGTNDAGQGSSLTGVTIPSIKGLINGLLSAGVTPILCTIPPRADFPARVANINAAIYRIAREYQIPLADFYSALVNASNGQWAQPSGSTASTRWTIDDIHPTPKGAGIIGYVLNQTVTNWIRNFPKALPAFYDDSTITAQSRNPDFTAITGTINTGSSYPSTGWNAPGTVTMSTVYNSAGSEPGSGKTMARSTPQVAGLSTLPNYLGNTWALVGDGTHQLLIVGPQFNSVVGHKIAFMVRIKWIPGAATSNIGDPAIMLYDPDGGNRIGGIIGTATFGGVDQTIQIGNETGYDAGDLYFEYTVPPVNGTVYPGYLGNVALSVRLQDHNGTGASNTGDTLCTANMRMIDLTAAGIVTP